MTTRRLLWRELCYRPGRFLLGLVSVAAAVASLLVAAMLLDSYQARTTALLAGKQAELQARVNTMNDDLRRAMLKLGFDVLILPRTQNLADFYTDDYAAQDMPEEYVDRLAKSRLLTIRHLLPSLQHKVDWPEARRAIILVGIRGELKETGPDAKEPLVQPVLPGQLVLGYELHRGLTVKPGDRVQFRGRDFTVAKTHEARGTKDDITAWMDLATAQELLGKPGRINGILAVECKCAWADLPQVRAEITRILPETQVIERASEALARAEARRKLEDSGQAALAQERAALERLQAERERLVAVLVPVILLVCGLGVAFLAFAEARDRRIEIAVLRALGLRQRQVFGLFVGKAALMGVAGGLLGTAAALPLGTWCGAHLVGALAEGTGLVSLPALGAALLAAPLLTIIAGWLPASQAARQDPADLLREA